MSSVRLLNTQPSARPRIAASDPDHWASKCPELSARSFRPGAYDAYSKPSLAAGGERRPYRFSLER